MNKCWYVNRAASEALRLALYKLDYYCCYYFYYMTCNVQMSSDIDVTVGDMTSRLDDNSKRRGVIAL